MPCQRQINWFSELFSSFTIIKLQLHIQEAFNIHWWGNTKQFIGKCRKRERAGYNFKVVKSYLLWLPGKFIQRKPQRECVCHIFQLEARLSQRCQRIISFRGTTLCPVPDPEIRSAGGIMVLIILVLWVWSPYSFTKELDSVIFMGPFSSEYPEFVRKLTFLWLWTHV